MRYRSRSDSNSVRTITAKFSGDCHCCGATIPAGRMVHYLPAKKAIAHMGGFAGNSPECAREIRRKQFPEYAAELERKAGYVDVDTMYEDQCADICGR